MSLPILFLYEIIMLVDFPQKNLLHRAYHSIKMFDASPTIQNQTIFSDKMSMRHSIRIIFIIILYMLHLIIFQTFLHIILLERWQ